MLTDRITLAPTAELEPEDYFSSALGVIFPDDITNQHGDPSTPVTYTSPTYGKVFLNLADPVGEDSRKLFAQYLWNAGVYIAVALEDAVEGTVFGERLADSEENNTAGDKADGNESHHSAETLLDARNDTQLTDSTIQPSITTKTTTPPPTKTSHQQKSPWDVRNETVLELGSGTGLAGIIAAKCGARRVLLTDYPAPEVLANLSANVERNLSDEERGRCRVEGHEWGVVPPDGGDGDGGDDEGKDEGREGEGHKGDEDRETFTRVLVADCLWMPSQHENLHRSIAYYLAPSPSPSPPPPPTASPAPSPVPSPSPFPQSSSSPSSTTIPSATHPNSNQTPHKTTPSRALIVAGFHTGRAKLAPFFDDRALARAGLCLESIVERDAVGRERPWVRPRSWPGGGGRGDGGGGGGAGEGGEGEGGAGGGRGGERGEEEEIGDAEGRAGISERKRWLVVAVLKRL